MKRLRVCLLCVVLLAVAGCENSQMQQAEEATAKSGGKILAKWEREWKDDLGLTDNNTLLFRNGKMFLQSYIISDADGVGEVQLNEVIERPVESPNERRFDFNEGKRSEYFTLSATGAIKYYSWEGRQFANLQTTFVDPEAMTVGSKVQARECTPKQLSAGAVEAVRLYKQLHAFKDDVEFGEMGFSSAGPYHVWLEAIQGIQGGLDRAARVEVTIQLGIPINNIMTLGMKYMSEATGNGDPDNRQQIKELERTLQASLALAFCE